MLLRSFRITTMLAAFIVISTGVAGAEDGDDDYPVQIIARPFTLPQGAIQVGADAYADKSFDTVGMAAVVDYGLMEKLQLGLGYGIPLKEFDIKGDAFAQVNYLFLTGGKVEGMAIVGGGYSIGGEALLPVDAGALFWLTINNMIAVYTVPGLSVALAEVQGDDPAVPATKPIYASIPVALALQPLKKVYVEVATEVATINISDSATTVIGADYLPVSVTGYLSPSNKMDIGVGASWADLKGDSAAIELLATVRLRSGI